MSISHPPSGDFSPHATYEKGGQEMITVRFIQDDGVVREVQGPLGMTILELTHMHDIDMEGACGGALACSTCHGIIGPEWYDALPPASEAEEDMIDLATNPTPTSRLCCQILLTKELDGITITVPAQRRNLVLKPR